LDRHNNNNNGLINSAVVIWPYRDTLQVQHNLGPTTSAKGKRLGQF